MKITSRPFSELKPLKIQSFFERSREKVPQYYESEGRVPFLNAPRVHWISLGVSLTDH